ncbi:MAG TPA: tetratricopeptide repeat protein [Pirellulales bacterium]|nr:tetratricopeptide repeat protein [Pirellulales bacterium]
MALALLIAFAVIAMRAWQRGDLQSQLSLARVSLREFHPDDAAARLSQVALEHPDCAEAEFLLACAYRRAGRLDLVEPHLRRAAELGWPDAEIDRQFCLTFFQAGDFRRSASDLMDQLRAGGSDDEADDILEAMANGYIAAMLLKQATFVLDEWVRWRPCARAHLLRADVAAFAGDEQGEIECLRAAVRCEPSNFDAQRMLAHASISGHDIDTAESLFRSCLRQRPNDPDILLGLAECQERRGEEEEAKKQVALVLSSQPSNRQRSTALALLGQTALGAKDNPGAIEYFQQAVEADPSNMSAVYSLAQSLTRAGRNDEADRYRERWQRLKGLDQTLEELHSQLLQSPQDPDVRAQIGQALIEQGSTKLGVNWLLTALLYDPAHVFANRRLAEYYEREGQKELAATHRVVADAREQASSAKAAAESTSDKDESSHEAAPDKGGAAADSETVADGDTAAEGAAAAGRDEADDNGGAS